MKEWILKNNYKIIPNYTSKLLGKKVHKIKLIKMNVWYTEMGTDDHIWTSFVSFQQNKCGKINKMQYYDPYSY